MNSDSTMFEYDDFEQYLLDAAAVDEAPADLPARLGVALGLGVPMLAAAEITSLAPTTNALGAAAQAGGSAASSGVLGGLKASLGVTASTLWGTAVKGVAVGLIAGTAAIGTGRAVAKLTSDDTPPTTAPLHERSLATRVAAATPALPISAAASADPISWLDAVEEQKVEEQKEEARNARVLPSFNVPFSRVPESVPDPEEEKPRKRLPRPIFPEKTYAVARYPIFWEDVSAYYDTPQKQYSVPAVAAFAEERPLITPAEVVELRAKTIQRSRTYLGQSKPSLALNELNQFRSRVGDRYFGVDELLLHIEALAMMGRAIEAQADVKVVERLAPNSAALRQAQQLAASRFVR